MDTNTRKNEFTESVYALVVQIPTGRVMTYGQIAALAGNARASRIVGGLAHFGDLSLPWHRVVNKRGGLAVGYPGGREGHKRDLEREGIQVSGSNGDYWVDVSSLLWSPA